MNAKRGCTIGFTLIELLIAMAIFSIVIVFFITMFLTITRIQVRQSSLAEVNGQSTFLLQEMQYYIEQASLIDMPLDTPTTTLKLRMPGVAVDPTVITVNGGTIYLQQASGSLQALSSNKVAVSNLTFTKHANAPGHDSVSIAFTVAYNTGNIQQLFSEMLQTSVAQVSAATFDSDLLPSSTWNNNLGLAGQLWKSINGLLYFSSDGTKLGIGAGSNPPSQTLDVNGGVRINSSGAPAGYPNCASSLRGTLWVYPGGGAGGGDTLLLCVFTSSSAYTWVPLY